MKREFHKIDIIYQSTLNINTKHLLNAIILKYLTIRTGMYYFFLLFNLRYSFIVPSDHFIT